MEKPAPSRTPLIITVVLLLLPVLYVASYCALVWPDKLRHDLLDSRWEVIPKYRYGTAAWAERLYWPLEKIDRRLRPTEWQG